MAPDNRPANRALQALHGNITVENTIRDIVPYVQTGDLHIAVYDHDAMLMYVSVAAPAGTPGPLNAYQRQFFRLELETRLEPTALRPSGCCLAENCGFESCASQQPRQGFRRAAAQDRRVAARASSVLCGRVADGLAGDDACPIACCPRSSRPDFSNLNAGRA